MFSAFAGTCIFMKCATRNELKRKIHKKCNHITEPRTKQHTVIQDYLKMDWMCSLFFSPVYVYLFSYFVSVFFFHRIFHSVVTVFYRNIWFVGSFFGFPLPKVNTTTWFRFEIFAQPIRSVCIHKSHDICCLLSAIAIAISAGIGFVSREFLVVFQFNTENHLYRLNAIDVHGIHLKLKKTSNSSNQNSFTKHKTQHSQEKRDTASDRVKESERMILKKQIDRNTVHNMTSMAHTIRTQHRTWSEWKWIVNIETK